MVFQYHFEVLHRLFSTSFYALGGNVDDSRVVFLRLREAWTSSFYVVGLSLLLGVLFPHEYLRCTLAPAA